MQIEIAVATGSAHIARHVEDTWGLGLKVPRMVCEDTWTSAVSCLAKTAKTRGRLKTHSRQRHLSERRHVGVRRHYLRALLCPRRLRETKLCGGRHLLERRHHALPDLSDNVRGAHVYVRVILQGGRRIDIPVTARYVCNNQSPPRPRARANP